MEIGTKEMQWSAQQLASWSQELCAFFLARLGSAEMAQELAQEAILRLLRVSQAGQVIRQPRAWLFHVGRNLAVDQVRKRLPHPVGLDWRSREVDPHSLEVDEPLYKVGELEVPRSELLRMMPEAMNRLAQEDRWYLQAYYHQRQGVDSLAKEECKSPTTIKGRLYRARQRLREQLLNQAEAEQHKW